MAPPDPKKLKQDQAEETQEDSTAAPTENAPPESNEIDDYDNSSSSSSSNYNSSDAESDSDSDDECSCLNSFSSEFVNAIKSGSRKSEPKPAKGPKVEEIGGKIIKSPLDTNGYKAVRLSNNGLQGFLISTCLHPREGIDNVTRRQSVNTKNTCIFGKIADFNKKYAEFDTKAGDEQENSSSIKFAKASESQVKANKKIRGKKVTATRKVKAAPKIKAKCRTGVRVVDDEVQNFCNTKCAVNLYIRSGFFKDPPEFPGMAHLCEHCVSLGSKNYPAAEQFSQFVEENGGFTNARTDVNYTSYYFYVDYEFIEEALDIFTDMFVNPIFDAKKIRKEIDAVNSEFVMKRLRDEFRHLGLLKSCFHRGHPSTNFGMGSTDTLDKEGLFEALQGWFHAHYNPRNMLFSIQGPMSLERLEGLFARFGSRLVDKSNVVSKIPRPCGTPKQKNQALPPVDLKKWNQIYSMNPAGNAPFMCVSWVVHPKFGNDHVTKPIQYLSYILCKKERGSLDWYLKQKGWVISLNVSNPALQFYATEYHTIFNLKLQLTRLGLEKRMEVAQAVFLYIKLLQRAKASKTLFDELRQLVADIFHYRSDMNLSDPTIGRRVEDESSDVSTEVNDHLFTILEAWAKTGSPSQVLLNSFLVRKWNPELINQFIDSLTPRNAMICCASKDFKGTKTEEWFQTRYRVERNDAFFQKIDSTPIPPEMLFPVANRFVATSYCFSEAEPQCRRDRQGSNLLVHQSKLGEVTYGNMTCKKGLLPSATYTLQFLSPSLEDETNPWTYTSIDILTTWIKYELDMELAQALSSLISCDVKTGSGSLFVELSGPSTKLPPLAAIILNVIKTLDQRICQPQRQRVFENLKQESLEYYQGVMLDSERCGLKLLQYAISWKSYFESDFGHILENGYSFCDFKVFVEHFNSRLFVNADLDGCVTRCQACQFVASLVGTNFPVYRRKTENMVYDRIVQLPLGERCLYVEAKNKEDANSVVFNYYQVGNLYDEMEKKMWYTIRAKLSEVAFEELRTKKNLGYVADAEPDSTFGVHGFIVSVVGSAEKHTCGSINEEIDDFLQRFAETYFKSKKVFKDNLEVFLPEGESLNWEQTKKFYSDFLTPCGPKFRKLSVQIQGLKKEPGSCPAMPKLLKEKKLRYSSGVERARCDKENCGISNHSRFIEICRKNVNEENGYFITDLPDLKDSLVCFPRAEEDLLSDED